MQRSRWLLLALLATVCGVSPSWSQKPTSEPQGNNLGASTLSGLPSTGDVTPEMWFYIQEYQRYKSPEEAVRRKAEMRAAQRQHRLEAQRWFGFSNLRPTANPIPYFGTYSPSWAGGSWDPYSWHGVGARYVTYPTSSRAR